MDRDRAVVANNAGPPDRSVEKSDLGRAFKWRYIVALLVVAGLTIASGVAGYLVLDAQASTSATIDTAGRQRMLSQRIPLLAGLLADAPSSERADLRESLAETIDAMERAQTGLIEGDAALGLDGDAGAAVLEQFESGTRVDVEQFLELASTALDPDLSTEELDRIAGELAATANGGLLAQLESIASLTRIEAENDLDRIALGEQLVVLATLLVLAIEALFVFRPLHRRVRRETARLEEVVAQRSAEANRHSFGLQLRDAVELADTEEELVEVIGQAVEVAGLGFDLEVLMAMVEPPDSLYSTATNPVQGCSVERIGGCPALRRGRTLVLAEPSDLGGCAHFRRDCATVGRRHSTTCVPMSFLGTGIGVLRLVGDVAHCPTESEVRIAEAIGKNAGTHVGTLRALEQSRLDAQRDPLTGLLNRRGLEQAAAGLERSRTPFVVIAIDLDEFKSVNDEFGHDVGDQVLVTAAATMTSMSRPTDIVARHGGEEFVIVVPLRGENGSRSYELAAGLSLAERVRSSFAHHLSSGDQPACTASFGVAGPFVGDIGTGLQRADEALYRAKRNGRNRVEADGTLLTELAADLSLGPPTDRTSTSRLGFEPPVGAQPERGLDPPEDLSND